MEKLIEYEPIVGVDIAPDYIRATQIERVGGEYHLRNIGIVSTPPDSLEDGRIINPRLVGRALKELFRERNFETTKVATAIRGKGVVSRIITFPTMPQDRLRKLIEAEVNRYVLFSNEDKVVYYHPIEEYDENDRRKINVMLVVAQKSLCRSYFEAFREAGLELTSIDLSTFCILREMRNSIPNSFSRNMMSLTFDYNGVAMNIFNGNDLRFSRNIFLDERAMQGLGNGFKDKLVGELLMALDYYQTEYSRGDTVHKLVMSAGAPRGDEVFDAVMESVSEMPSEVHGPFANIRVDLDSFPAGLMDQVDSNFLTSVGLALRGQELELLPFQVDLLPAEIAEVKLIRKHVSAIVRAALVVSIIFAGAMFFVNNRTDKLKAETRKISLQQQNITREVAEYKKRKLENLKLNPAPADFQVTPDLSPVLEEIKKVIPKTVQLTELRFHQPDVIEFIGVAEANPSIFYFISSLKNSAVFTDIELGPRKAVTAFDRSMIGFDIRCKYKGVQ